jgi:predicted DCC family thiol-disulfide oxidoreductase YuxK
MKRSAQTESLGAVLVYDGDCAFCKRCVAAMHRFVARAPRSVPCQAAPLADLGLTRQQCDEAVQWVCGAEQRSGARAVAAVLRHGGAPWFVIGALLDAPMVRSVAAAVYRRVARRRSCLVEPSSKPVER